MYILNRIKSFADFYLFILVDFQFQQKVRISILHFVRCHAWSGLLHGADSPQSFNHCNTMLDRKSNVMHIPIFINVFWLENTLKLFYVLSKYCFDDLKWRRHSRENNFFAFAFKIHLRTKCAFNICQLIIFNVLTLHYISNIVLKWLKL